jgi:hypothetical protein
MKELTPDPSYVLKPFLEALRDRYDQGNANEVREGIKVTKNFASILWPATDFQEILTLFSHRLREPFDV